VQILAGLAFLALAALRLVPALRRSLGSTLHDVSRSSIGDLLFPLAIAILFTLSHHDPVLYLVPLLLLTIADAAGALAGIRYGKTRFGTSEGFKSVEGSLSFLFLAFLCAHL
ncbi:MAG: cytidylyltransferase, partial [Akkermansiaceae bacterium]|nr:cytidylyltransferase [Akkermansiaceae bacterium]